MPPPLGDHLLVCRWNLCVVVLGYRGFRQGARSEQQCILVFGLCVQRPRLDGLELRLAVAQPLYCPMDERVAEVLQLRARLGVVG